jgi:hypothetical protein
MIVYRDDAESSFRPTKYTNDTKFGQGQEATGKMPVVLTGPSRTEDKNV